MEVNPQTSFIPKKSLNESPARHSTAGLFALVSFIIFLASVVFAGGVFLYKITLEKDIQGQKEALEQTKGRFDASFIATIVRFNSRIETAKMLLKNHVAMTPVFSFVQENSVSTITFSNFSLKPAQEGSLIIEMTGTAPDYDSIAQQSDEFGKSRFLKDVIFSDLNPDSVGNIRFVFRAKVDPKLVSYESALLQKTGTTKPTNTPQ